MKQEPGQPLWRLTVALQPEAERQLTELRARLERKSGQRYSMARVIREAVDCLALREGL